MCNLVVRARNESGRNRLRRREEREEEEIFCFLRQKVSDNSDNHDLPRSNMTRQYTFEVPYPVLRTDWGSQRHVIHLHQVLRVPAAKSLIR